MGYQSGLYFECLVDKHIGHTHFF